jgi:hypothetical protein
LVYEFVAVDLFMPAHWYEWWRRYYYLVSFLAQIIKRSISLRIERRRSWQLGLVKPFHVFYVRHNEMKYAVMGDYEYDVL